ncbi:PQ-loop-domain-containing protein [Punctularia strigosozonata HHB-11173 SS5]|uniref:PQ-loop-domain-containing protein n=1 Tax=Punctularia strigosozonata (strain HHB-11173) TaxID=741275 RepID=UPI00044184F4|nr:PQ-loop-domain-containing protein [Punctularia strigosozonata HHB-11173 SS5]EIN09652.1 PQ-loop-domain-containing protein [Punctularia strigosozonata HHB-11173 SS5]
MPVNKVAENVFGIIGTICWTVQLVPQLIKSYREKSVEGLSSILVFMWGVAGIPLGIYAIVQNLNIPLIVQPQLFMVLCLASWAQCLYYGQGRSKRTSIIMWLGTCIFAGAFEAGMVFAIRPVYNHGHGNDAPVKVFGILAAIMISSALLPQYWEIYKHGEVIGISIIFMTVDMLGGVFNLLSLVFKTKLDTLAAISYSLVVALDGLVILLYFILNPLARRRRRRLAQRQPPDDTTPDLDGGASTSRDAEDNLPLSDAPTRVPSRQSHVDKAPNPSDERSLEKVG